MDVVQSKSQCPENIILYHNPLHPRLFYMTGRYCDVKEDANAAWHANGIFAISLPNVALNLK